MRAITRKSRAHEMLTLIHMSLIFERIFSKRDVVLSCLDVYVTTFHVMHDY